MRLGHHFLPFLIMLPLMVFTCNIFAVGIKDIKVGDVYYVPTSDGGQRLVRVAAVDENSNAVKILDENNVADWVRPNLLMTRIEADQAAQRARDAYNKEQEKQANAEAALALLPFAILACALTDTCKNMSAENSRSNNARSSGNNYDQLKGKYLLGFKGQNLEYFTYNGERYNYGVQVDSIMNGWPASRAGLKPKDIIYLVDGKMVKNMEFLLAYINSNTPGSSVKISYMRGDNIYDVFVAPQKYQ